MKWFVGLLLFFLFSQVSHQAVAQQEQKIPDRLVVLTFDDSALSHYTVARPILKQYEFGATFFITEGFDFKTNKTDYMTWEQIKQLHDDGFEIGNHTQDHLGINDASADRMHEQLLGIEQQCEAHQIPRPTSFAWPGNVFTDKAFKVMNDHGITFARRGGAPEYQYEEGKGVAYSPGQDHPLLLPTAGDARPDWTLENFVQAVQMAKDGKIAVLQFHGVPDTAHAWVNLNQQDFEAFMKYLAINKYKVIACRDLARYVDPEQKPDRWQDVIEQRQAAIAKAKETLAKETQSNETQSKETQAQPKDLSPKVQSPIAK